jgi:hypothetical protein
MVGVFFEIATTRGLAAVTCGIGSITTMFLDFTGEFSRFKVLRNFDIENVNAPPDDVWVMVTLVVVDGEFITTGVELGMFMDGMVVVPMGIGLDMAGAGLDIIPMPGLIEVMDSKCRPSSISTESVLFRPALRALGLRGYCS